MTINSRAAFWHKTRQRKRQWRVHAHGLLGYCLEVFERRSTNSVDIFIALESRADFVLQLCHDGRIPQNIIRNAGESGSRRFAAGNPVLNVSSRNYMMILEYVHKVRGVRRDLDIRNGCNFPCLDDLGEKVFPLGFGSQSPLDQIHGILLVFSVVLEQLLNQTREEFLADHGRDGKTAETVCHGAKA